MKKNIFILSFLLFNLFVINKIMSQTPIRFRAENGNIGLYDEVNHKVLTKENYSRISAFSEGIACAVVSDGASGLVTYLNKKGEKNKCRNLLFQLWNLSKWSNSCQNC